MEYKVEYVYRNLSNNRKLLNGIYLHFDKTMVWIFLNGNYHYLEISVKRQKNVKDKRKKIDVSNSLKGLIHFLNNNQFFCKNRSGRNEDILQLDKVKSIRIIGLKLCAKDSTVLCRFPNMKSLETENCTLYESCNLGYLKCSYYTDNSSLICNLDIFNGFEGDYFRLKNSIIKNR